MTLSIKRILTVRNCLWPLILFCLFCIIALIYVTGNQNENSYINKLDVQTSQRLRGLQVNLSNDEKRLEIDPKYLNLLGFNHKGKINETLYRNFTIISYVLSGQEASAIQLIENINQNLPNDVLCIYEFGLSEDSLKQINSYCNNSKCTVINYDLKVFPSHVNDERMHAFRPLIIKDALMHSQTVLFLENDQRIQATYKDIYSLMEHKGFRDTGVLGWTQFQPVTSRTHPKMFEYFDADIESFQFLPMVSMDYLLFRDIKVVNEKILLPWIKCTLTFDCIHPIGAQSVGCKYNKKPQYRYSGCHSYDQSAFNIVLGIQWQYDERYSIHGESNYFYKESIDESTRIMENRKRGINNTSEHLSTED